MVAEATCFQVAIRNYQPLDMLFMKIRVNKLDISLVCYIIWENIILNFNKNVANSCRISD